jgi:hypothetical protein
MRRSLSPAADRLSGSGQAHAGAFSPCRPRRCRHPRKKPIAERFQLPTAHTIDLCNNGSLTLDKIIDIDGHLYLLVAKQTSPPSPKCDVALTILAAIPRFSGSDLVFTITGKSPISGFSGIKARLDQASGVSDWTIHDLRRTFATIGTDELGIDPVVMDKILNHRSGVVTGIAAVYQRAAYLIKRKAAMDAWGEYLSKCAASVRAIRLAG